MKSHLYHLQLNINFSNLGLYQQLFKLLGWNVIFETDDLCGFTSGQSGDLWLVNTDAPVTDHDHRGLNHLAIKVEQSTDVDTVVSFLKEHSLDPLFDTPRHRPEFAASTSQTYYQVMFKTPDNILFEVVYVGER